eukprot:4072877-Pleurochrysis_carterae.AAC.3
MVNSANASSHQTSPMKRASLMVGTAEVSLKLLSHRCAIQRSRFEMPAPMLKLEEYRHRAAFEAALSFYRLQHVTRACALAGCVRGCNFSTLLPLCVLKDAHTRATWV